MADTLVNECNVSIIQDIIVELTYLHGTKPENERDERSSTCNRPDIHRTLCPPFQSLPTNEIRFSCGFISN